MKKITANDQKLALYFSSEDFPEGISFFTEDDDFLQVGSWNYQEGKYVQAHRHKENIERSSTRTQELVFVITGSLRTTIFDEDKQKVDEIVVEGHEGVLFWAGGHDFEILEDDTKIIEAKNGPFPGPDDKERFSYEE